MFSYSVTIHQCHLQSLAILLLSTNVTYNRLRCLPRTRSLFYNPDNPKKVSKGLFTVKYVGPKI